MIPTEEDDSNPDPEIRPEGQIAPGDPRDTDGGGLTVDLGDPPERHVVERGGVLVVEIGTPLQLRNADEDELVLFIYGAPPVTGQGEFLPDIP